MTTTSYLLGNEIVLVLERLLRILALLEQLKIDGLSKSNGNNFGFTFPEKKIRKSRERSFCSAYWRSGHMTTLDIGEIMIAVSGCVSPLCFFELFGVYGATNVVYTACL